MAAKEGPSAMAQYEYRCLKCKRAFWVTESMSEHGTRKHRCPACKSMQVQQTLTPFFAQTKKKA